MRGRILRVCVAVALAVGLGAASAGTAAPAGASGTSAAPWLPSMAGQFHGVRSRLESGLTIDPGITESLPVVGTGGVPSTGVASVALNLATKATSSGTGSLIVYPSDASRPAVTGARYRGDIWNDDLLLVKVGADGRVKIENNGPVQVLVDIDVYGYTLTSAGATPGSTFVGVTPARIVSNASVPAGGTFAFSPLGAGGVPVAGVSHVVFTLVGNSAAESPLTVYPSGTAKPLGVNLHASPNGSKDNLVIAQVGDDGKVVIENGGSSVATVSVDVSGYYATPDASPAGSVTVPVPPARIVNSVSIPGGGGLTVTPPGAGGVPSSGVSAVGMNLTVRSSNSTGSVRVYPSGAAQPGTWTVGYPTAGIHNAGFISAKLGTGGGVIVHNSGSSAVAVSVDVFAYFTPLTGCAPPATPAPPSVPVEESSPISVFQPTTGLLGQPLEYAFTADNGTVWYAHQQDPGNFAGAGFTLVPAPAGEAFSGPPALTDQADGRLRLFAHGVSGNTWLDSEPGAPAWSNLGGWMATPAAATPQPDGTVALFALDGNGTLWAAQQDSPNGPYGCWSDTGLTGLTGRPAVTTEPGGVRVFARDTAGGVKTALYADRALSGITDLGGSGLTGSLGVVDYPGDNARIFVRAADGSILTKREDLSGAFSQTWDPVGTFTAAGAPSAAFDGAGRLHVVALGADGIVHQTTETSAFSGVWGDWSSAQPADDTFRTATDPTAFAYTLGNGGEFWAYVVRDNTNLVRVYTPSSTASPASRFTSVRLAPHE